jgi:hypothetical protein
VSHGHSRRERRSRALDLRGLGTRRSETDGLGVEIQAQHLHAIHVREGKMTRLVAYYDRERAPGALRLPYEQGAR